MLNSKNSKFRNTMTCYPQESPVETDWHFVETGQTFEDDQRSARSYQQNPPSAPQDWVMNLNEHMPLKFIYAPSPANAMGTQSSISAHIRSPNIIVIRSHDPQEEDRTVRCNKRISSIQFGFVNRLPVCSHGARVKSGLDVEDNDKVGIGPPKLLLLSGHFNGHIYVRAIYTSPLALDP